jgi:hypothetical protein
MPPGRDVGERIIVMGAYTVLLCDEVMEVRLLAPALIPTEQTVGGVTVV